MTAMNADIPAFPKSGPFSPIARLLPMLEEHPNTTTYVHNSGESRRDSDRPAYPALGACLPVDLDKDAPGGIQAITRFS